MPRRDVDLFDLFPDLPYMRPRPPSDQVRAVHQKVEITRKRARENIERQRAAAERVRAAISARRRR